MAFVVADRFQHHGIGRFLLEQLAISAWQAGARTFLATTLTINREMLQVFADSGFHVQTTVSGPVVDVRFFIEPDERYRAAVARRHGGDPPGAAGPTE